MAAEHRVAAGKGEGIDLTVSMDPISCVIRLDLHHEEGDAQAEIDEKLAATLSSRILAGHSAVLQFRDTLTGRIAAIDLKGSIETADMLRGAAVGLRAQKDDKARIESWRALREHDHKYAYYKLTVTGAALAFALNETRQAHLSWPQIPLAAAVLSWAASVWFGFDHLRLVRSVLIENAAGGDLPSAPAAVKAGDRQLAFLIAGAVLYVAWHVLEMYLRGRAIEIHV